MTSKANDWIECFFLILFERDVENVLAKLPHAIFAW
jgi:hypothetical protein